MMILCMVSVMYNRFLRTYVEVWLNVRIRLEPYIQMCVGLFEEVKNEQGLQGSLGVSRRENLKLQARVLV